MTVHRFYWILLGSVLLTACDESTSPDPARSGPAAHSRAADPGGPVRTQDEIFNGFVQDLPGFGGVFVEGATGTDAGRITVVLTSPGALPETAVRARLATLFSRLNRPDLSERAASGVSIVRGEHSFADLKRWYPKAVALLVRPGVTQTDIDERRNRIVVGVASAADREAVLSALTGSGVPESAMIVEVSPAPVNEQRLSDVVSKRIGGIRIRSELAACTLGYNAKLSRIDGIPVLGDFFITASHCTGAYPYHMGVVTGLEKHQPRAWNPIAHEVADPPFRDTGNGTCPSGQCRYSDAAVFKYYDGVDNLFAHIAHVGSGSDSLATIQGYHRVNAHSYSILGETVHKIGSATGYSDGTVRAVCANVQPLDQFGYPIGYTLNCQNRADYRSASGDSGAPVYVRLSSTTRYAVGLHWGGGGYYSQIGHVLSEIAEFWGSGATLRVSVDGAVNR